MKLNKYSCIMALALVAAPLLASPAIIPVDGVLVSSNSITIPHKGFYDPKNKVTLGGISLSCYQLGKSNLVATLPPGLPAGTYALYVRGEREVDLALGVQGPQGIQGIQGIQGVAGPQGETGPQGVGGAQGAQGPQGIPGTPGIQGIQGIAGLNGTNGVDGINGTNGVDGINGTNGVQGIQGIQGVAGPQGETGPQGAVGPTGPQGPQGIQGIQGIAGLNGTNGVDGINGTNGVLVSNFIHAYAVGAREVLANGSIQFSNSVVNSGNSTIWSADGINFIIPATGVYEIKFMINADGSDLGDPAPANIGVDISDATTPFVTADGVDQGYFQFGGGKAGSESGQIIEHCTAGDSISIKNVSTGAFSIGSFVPTNAPSATISILQIQ